MTGSRVRIRGASRTDSGAHAEAQVVDFLTCSPHSPTTFLFGLNYHLPEDIRVIRVAKVSPEFNSRRSATGRVYQYRILARQAPTAQRRHSHCWVREGLDTESMTEAAQHLLGTHDFRPFASGHPEDKSAVRQVSRWDVFRRKDEVIIESEANGFLKQQIRRVNAALVEIGKGKQPIDLVQRTLETDGTVPQIPLLPARGLCLIEVKYPAGVFEAPEPETGRDL